MAVLQQVRTTGSLRVEQNGEETTEKKYKVPVIDLNEVEGSGRARIRDEIARACETWGFFQVVNHGVDLALVKRVRKKIREFFHLTDVEKLEYAKTAGHIEGYTRPGRDMHGNQLSTGTDHFFYYLYPLAKRNQHLWPRKPPGLNDAIDEYAKETKALGERLLALISEGLGLPAYTLQEKFNGPSGQPMVNIRANFYPRCSKGEVMHAPGLAEHTDPGGITLLLQDDVVGLQMKMNDEWVEIEPLPQAFCVNVGDQVEILSNGQYKSAEHRGLASCVNERLTIPIFVNPCFDKLIGPLRDLFNESRPAQYRSTTYLDYFALYMQRVGNGKLRDQMRLEIKGSQVDRHISSTSHVESVAKLVH